MTIERTEDAVTFSWRRNPAEAWVLVALLASFYGFMSVAIANSKTYGDENLAAMNRGVIFAFGVVILPCIYGSLALALNTKRVNADKSKVTRTYGPLWIGPNLSIVAEGIQQFFALTSYAARSSSSNYVVGAIYLIDSEGHVRLLATGLPSSFAANQIAHELEDFYGIEDLPVYGVTTDPAHPGPRGLHS